MQTIAYRNEAGQWRVTLTFDHTLSESDPRPEFNLGAQWANIRRRARRAIRRAITNREQKFNEPAAPLGRLHVVRQNIDSMNRWHGVTLGE